MIDFVAKIVWNSFLALVIGVSNAIVGNFMPRQYTNYERFPFKEYSFESGGKFYCIFGIEKWKDRLPDISKYIKSVFPKKVYVGFVKKDCEYFERFAKETCVSELVHFVLILISPIYLFLNWDINWGVMVMLINIVANIPFIMVQRYNRPRLVRIASKNMKINEEKAGV